MSTRERSSIEKYINKKKEEGKRSEIDTYNQVPYLTRDTIWKSDKTQENITHKKTERSAFFQQVITQTIDDVITSLRHRFEMGDHLQLH